MTVRICGSEAQAFIVAPPEAAHLGLRGVRAGKWPPGRLSRMRRGEQRPGFVIDWCWFSHNVLSFTHGSSRKEVRSLTDKDPFNLPKLQMSRKGNVLFAQLNKPCFWNLYVWMSYLWYCAKFVAVC